MTSSAGPLSGVRVVEMAGIGPAPFVGMMLAEMGADVIKVDRPGGSLDLGLPAEHDLLNRGRPAVRIDVKSAEGVQTVRRMVDVAEVFVEGYRPGVAERLGLGPDDLLARRSALVYGRMTGWGQTGPWAQTAGHDIGYIAVTGDLHAIGPAEAPVVPLNLVGDFGGGALYLVSGILAALLHARTSGEGQVVDAAIMDGATHLSTLTRGMLNAGAWTDARGQNFFDGTAPFYTVYATSDDKHMAVGALEPQFYDEFIRLLDAPEPLPDRRDRDLWPRLREAIARRFVTKTRDEWTAVFSGSDACVAPVLSMTEAAEHPQMKARGTLIEYAGAMQPAPAPRFSATPTSIPSPPTAPVEDPDEVLASWGL